VLRSGFSRLLYVVPLFILGLVVPMSALAVSYDSIYPTQNATWDCQSWGPHPVLGTTYCQADDTKETYWFAPSGLSSSEKGEIRSVLNQEYGDTVINPSETDTPVWSASGDGETDLIMDESDLDYWFPGQHFLGVSWCEDMKNLYQCDQAYAFFDISATAYLGHSGYTSLACHEIGHTFGLTHPGMAYPAQVNPDDRFKCMNLSSFIYTGPGTNNKTQINQVYG
jgi:hypothetical protein